MTPHQMAALHQRCFQIPRPWTEAEFARITDQFSTRVIFNSHGLLVGRVLLEDAEILTLAVDPDHRRQGAARGLLDSFLNQAASEGAERAFLDVVHDNAPAIALYKQAGFEEIHRRKDYFRHPDGRRSHGLVLHRDLP